MKQWLSANESVLLSVLEDLDTPLSLAVWLEIKYKEWDHLALRYVDPRNYPEGVFSSLRFKKDVQAVDLLRKAPLPTTFNRRDAAMAAWEQSETRCYITNEFIETLRAPGIQKDPIRAAYSEFLRACKNRLSRWLGRIPDSLEGGFGPGTCVEYESSDPTVVDKIWLTPTTTPSASLLFEWHYSSTLWGRERWANRLGAPGVSRGNRLTTVPKDGKTDRPISIEPLGNLWLQKGIGRHLKRKLTAVGFPAYKPDSREIFPGYTLTKRDAQSIHRELVFRCGDEALSTIDLSSASDTVARELVRELLPDDWFQLLDDCRSKMTLVPSKGRKSWRHIEKFSSMGNGYTFELESMVFGVLLSVAFGLTPGRDLWVFGDDIILPKRFFDSACNLLEMSGFEPNRRKSFRDVPFFESCGGNVHGRIDVTPVRLKGPLEDIAAIYAFHNALYHRGFSRRTLRKVRNMIPRALQFPGPSRLGDIVLHGLPFETRYRDGIYTVKSLRLKPEYEIPLERWSPELAMSALLLGCPTRVVRRRTGTIPVSGWTSVS